MPRDGGGVAHEVLQIEDVIPGCGGGWSDRNGWKENLQVALDELFHRELIILRPVWGHWAERGGLSETFWCNPLVVCLHREADSSRSRFACLEDCASARRAAAGSAAC